MCACVHINIWCMYFIYIFKKNIKNFLVLIQILVLSVSVSQVDVSNTAY